jgi:PAS domain
MLQDGGAFRAQLVVPEQRQLFDYWLSKARSTGMPCRADINPTEIPRLLSGISLIEVAPELMGSRIRLAGTRLREAYDREITGLCLSDMEWGARDGYWTAAYERVVLEGLPSQGVVMAPSPRKDHLVQYWLRLPLQCQNSPGRTKTGMVLCYDTFMAASDRMDGALAAIA